LAFFMPLRLAIRIAQLFCNGPRKVNPSLRCPLAGSRFCTGSARGRHQMGFEEDRPTNLRMRGRSADWMGSGLT
jgi:hypothetical protein